MGPKSSPPRAGADSGSPHGVGHATATNTCSPRLWLQFWSLGSGRDHVMDAIAQCEQLAQERGESHRQSPWRIYFRKEFFTPWHNSQEDPVSTELIYRQVIHGVWSGEYSFEKEEELVELLARHCYVQLGASAESKAVQELLPSCIPHKLYRTKPPDRWASLVTATCAKVVDAALLQWPLLFSRLFEVITLSGSRLPKTKLILAINWKGLCFLDQREKTLLELSFPEVMGLATNREAQGGQRLLLSMMHEEYEFVSPSSVAIAELVALFLEGLKERSMFAMALQDRKATEVVVSSLQGQPCSGLHGCRSTKAGRPIPTVDCCRSTIPTVHGYRSTIPIVHGCRSTEAGQPIPTVHALRRSPRAGAAVRSLKQSDLGSVPVRVQQVTALYGARGSSPTPLTLRVVFCPPPYTWLHPSKEMAHKMPAQPLALQSPQQMAAFCSLCPGLTDDATLLAFKKGDLLVLTKKQGLLASENWTLGQNDRTGKTGLVPTACLYTIPTVTKPSAQLLVTGTLSCPQPGHPSAGWSGPGMPSWEAKLRAFSPPRRGQEGYQGMGSALPAPTIAAASAVAPERVIQAPQLLLLILPRERRQAPRGSLTVLGHEAGDMGVGKPWPVQPCA
ncbi:hypothetical protein P7K49_014354 [Saguinus oedipus]|uniref:SH3 domain-containing protein n=1 Tax=Saguinus oedipus TaxID=9490 RepID=A0ABQ9VIK1_SAGOE|nr:hypothetical protein P7K49_014354 [Saguinus oedipus]